MLITDSFVMLNLPKTGSTFVRSAIQEIYTERRKQAPLLYKLSTKLTPLNRLVESNTKNRLFLVELMFKTSSQQPKNQHGYYSQIPLEYRDREVASVIRNPYDRFLSIYKYQWWVKYPHLDENIIFKHFPHFPDLSLDEFVDLQYLRATHSPSTLWKDQSLYGNQTKMFIKMFSKNPDVTFEKIANHGSIDQIVDSLADITFLKQENLTNELATFLEKHNFSVEELNLVKNKKKVNENRKGIHDGKELWTPKALEYVREQERILFQVLKKLGIIYSPSEYEQTVSVTS